MSGGDAHHIRIPRQPRSARWATRPIGACQWATRLILFLFTPACLEDLFVEGGDDPVPGELPAVWGMERVMQIAHLVERTGLTVMPED